jgi:Ca2+-binding RTX toxin-like protein
MAFTIDAGRFVNTGTIRGGFSMGDRSNFLDTTKGLIYGRISTMGGNDTVRGGKIGEFIDGGTGKDNLNGGLGNDKLLGGEGQDVLTGGLGKDTFIFGASPLATNADRVRDFSSADDTFQIKKAFFTAFMSNGKLSAGAFRVGASAADAEDRIVYNKATGNLYYDADGTGAEAQVLIATLTNKAKLTLSDFIIA